MNNLWAHLRDALARRIRYKITRGGTLFMLAIVLVSVAAIVSANNLLFLILAAMLATLLVSGFVSRLCLAALELDFLVPEHIPAGRYVPGKLYVRNQKWLMPSFSIRVEGVRQPRQPHAQIGHLFPAHRRRRHARRDGGSSLSQTRRLPPEQLRLPHLVSLRLPGKIGARHPAAAR